MGHPRRPNSTVSSSSASNSRQQSLNVPLRNYCSDDVKREHNLKVLKRRDPSAVAILETFEFVTIYKYLFDQQEWEKTGVEGCLFMYERNQYPAYGLFLLNRNGMDDYTQWMQPGDDISPVMDGRKDFAAIKFYPDWTTQRLARLYSEHQHEPHRFNDKFSPLYALPNKIPSELKGEGFAVGFWSFLEPGRELSNVMALFHHHAQQNTPYPDNYRYGPGRLPSPTPLRNDSLSATVPLTPPIYTSAPGIRTLTSLVGENMPAPKPTNSSAPGTSTVDQLFAQFLTPAASATSTAAPAQSATPFSAAAPITTKLTMQSLFDSVSRPQQPAQQKPHYQQPKPPSQPASDDDQVVIPTRNTTPKILDRDALSHLLGFQSTASSLRSPSVHSIAPSSHSREADNEDGDTTSPSEPESLVVPRRGDLTPRPPFPTQAHHVPIKTSSAGRPLVPFQDQSSLWPYNNHNHNGNSGTDSDVNGNGDVNGTAEEEILEVDFSDMSALMDSMSTNKAKKKRNRRKEKDAKERAEIEKSWDAPIPVQYQQQQSLQQPPPLAPQSPPPPPTVPKIQMNGNGKVHVNGKSKTNGTHASGLVDEKAAIDSILAQNVTGMQKSEFVRELLTLIHTDKSFVDRLWADYQLRHASS